MFKDEKVYTDVANLHINSIKTGFLPSLGTKFLALLYRCIDESDFAILIVNYEEDKLKGFVTGTLGTSSLYKLLLKHPLSLTLALMPVVFNFKKVKKIINIWNHMSGSDRKNYPSAELLTICVDSDYQRQGVAVDLYKKLKSYFKDYLMNEFVIIVGQSLDANRFYLSQGAEIFGELQVHSGVVSNVFIQRV
tara:strand:- start:298 stop:873 length:576 start_codon:yes stop_codon:yes gene_type:complete